MVDLEGNTALHLTTRNTSQEITELLVQQDRSLLNVCNKAQRHAINNAVLANNQIVVRALLDHGADAQVRDKEGHTLIHYAAGMFL